MFSAVQLHPDEQMNPFTTAEEDLLFENIQRLLNASKSFQPNVSSPELQDTGHELLFVDAIFNIYTEVFFIILYSIVAVVGFSSNLLMITSLLIPPVLIKEPCYFRFFLLMISNLMMCFFCLPFTLIILIRRHWVLGQIACQFIPYFQSVAVIINTLTTAVISVDRLLLVTRNSLRRSNRASSISVSGTWHPLAIETVGIWSIAFIVSLPIPMYQDFVDISIGKTIIIRKCVELWPKGHWKGAYLVVNMLFQFLIPALILLTTFTQITRHLHSSQARSHANRTSSSRLRLESYSTFTDRSHVSVRVDSLTRSQHQRDQQVSRVLFWIVVCYITTWGPWNVYNIYLNYFVGQETDEEIVNLKMIFLYLLVMLTIPVNALLYGWINPCIRKQAVRVLASFKLLHGP